MTGVAQILEQIEGIDKPRCNMPPRVGCRQLAEYAYFDHTTNEVLYRCKRHKITIYNFDDELFEAINTIEEAIIREVMNV